jgi:hypothetical protein
MALRLTLQLSQSLLIVAYREEIVVKEVHNILTRILLREGVQVLEDVHSIDGTLLIGRCKFAVFLLEICLDDLHLAVDSLDDNLVGFGVVDAIV